MSLDSSMLIPRETYQEYHKRYNNETYRAFSRQLARHIPAASSQHIETMNWLIDCCFERLGAAPYRGAGARLATALLPLRDDTLFVLAERPLSRFTDDEAQRDALLTAALLYYVEAQVGSASGLANRMQVLACDHHRWTGRVAYYWLTGIVYLLLALRAVLREDAASYIREKFTVAVGQIASGLAEATLSGLHLKNVIEHDASSE